MEIKRPQTSSTTYLTDDGLFILLFPAFFPLQGLLSLTIHIYSKPDVLQTINAVKDLRDRLVSFVAVAFFPIGLGDDLPNTDRLR